MSFAAVLPPPEPQADVTVIAMSTQKAVS